MWKSVIALISFVFFLVGCGTESSPVETAQKTSDSLKKMTQGKVAPVVKEVGTMANSTQDI
jgi:PBP1b-binding outer membrane lipoprotein LpoB